MLRATGPHLRWFSSTLQFSYLWAREVAGGLVADHSEGFYLGTDITVDVGIDPGYRCCRCCGAHNTDQGLRQRWASQSSARRSKLQGVGDSIADHGEAHVIGHEEESQREPQALSRSHGTRCRGDRASLLESRPRRLCRARRTQKKSRAAAPPAVPSRNSPP